MSDRIDPRRTTVHPLIQELIRFGLSSQQIADRLGVSGRPNRNTVDRWRRGFSYPQVRFHDPIRRLIQTLKDAIHAEADPPK